jgi:3-methyladenine DNA glycosylase/8-oxoguanine DNA glycosylase
MPEKLIAAKPYDFAQSVKGHGWIELAPVRWLEATQRLQWVERLSSGRVVVVQVSAVESDEDVELAAHVEAARILTENENEEIASKLRWMLRLDEEFGPFYELAMSDGRFWSAVKVGRGRLLRSPSLFEDVVKTICTTNTTWRQTVNMVERLVTRLGEPYAPDPKLHAFPTAEQVAAADLELLRQEIRLGYRSVYILQLAQEVVAGERDLESLKVSSLPRDELKKELKSIKGVGEYAANTLLMLLGYYGELALDSEMRSFVSRYYFEGQAASDQDILSIYDRWGEWKYLAYWFDPAP